MLHTSQTIYTSDGIGSSQERKRIRDAHQNAAHQYVQEMDK